MSVALRKPMTLDAFLDWEGQQPTKYEFDGFEPVAMTGVTADHSVIQGNLLRHLLTRLDGKPCRAHGSDLKVLAAGRIRYPDAFVVCSPVPRGTTIIEDPVVVFEILCRGIAGRDRVEKNQNYRDTPSIRRYVMLEQTRQAATVFERVGDDWVGHLLVGDAELAMPEIGVTLPLAPLYAGVDLAGDDILDPA
jgi:Uma2 family endonuclease